MNDFLGHFQSKFLFALYIVHSKLYHFLVSVCSMEYVLCTYTLYSLKKTSPLLTSRTEWIKSGGGFPLRAGTFFLRTVKGIRGEQD